MAIGDLDLDLDVAKQTADRLGGDTVALPLDVTDVAALRHPRFEVFVPRSLAAMNRFTRLLPRSLGEWVVRSLKGDQVMVNAAHSSARKDYEARAAASAPAVDKQADA